METILDSKTQVLVALGAAVAAKCQTCFVKLSATAGELDVSDSEIRATVAIANKVAEKSRGFMAAFVEETTAGRVPAAAEPSAATGGCACA